MGRPGSVIGPQQIYLEDIQDQMWSEGDKYHNRQGPNFNNSNNRLGLSGKKKLEQKQESTKLFQKVLQHETWVTPKGLTQGDRLRAVKAMTHKSPGNTPVREKRLGKERTISAVGGTRSKSPESGYGITTRSKSKVEENRSANRNIPTNGVRVSRYPVRTSSFSSEEDRYVTRMADMELKK